MSRALSRFAFGSKLRLMLTLLIAFSSAMAGSAALIRSFDLSEFKAIKFLSPDLDLQNLLRSLPRVSVPQMKAEISELPATAGWEKQPAVVRVNPLPASALASHTMPIMPVARQVQNLVNLAQTNAVQPPVVATVQKPPTLPLPAPFVRTATMQSHSAAIATAGNSGHPRPTTTEPAAAVATAEPETHRKAKPVEKASPTETALTIADASSDWNQPAVRAESALDPVTVIAAMDSVSLDTAGAFATVQSYSNVVLLWNGQYSHLDLDLTLVSNGISARPIAVIPEPGAISILLVGIGLLARRRR